MRAPLLVALLAALAVSCRQSPPGRCSDHPDCPQGRECAAGVCVRLETDGLVGSRCVRDADCAAWAGCAGERCALRTGACGGPADCQAWEACDAHACVLPPGGCRDASGCAAWQVCTAYRCETAPGRCAATPECPSWQVCDATHACVSAPGMCTDGAECASWQVCTAHQCAPAQGRCATSSACAAWQVCDPAAHVCAAGPGFCADGAGCAAWQVCSAAHRCAPAPGRCAAQPDCADWQVCDASHVCVAAPGFCADSSACADWQVCDATNVCAAAPGRCAVKRDCPYWQDCDASHTCVVGPGWCVDSSACADWQTCSAHACTPSPGRCDKDANCDLTQACDTAVHACAAPKVDPGVVYLMGTLESGYWSKPYAMQALGVTGARPLVGFQATSDPTNGLIGADGLYYLWGGEGAATVRRFVPDALYWRADVAKYMYPSDPAANDPLLTPAVSCRPTGRWTLIAGTSELRVECYDLGWYDFAGKLQWQGDANTLLLRWNASGRKLLGGASVMYVVDPDDTRHQVTGVTLDNYDMTLAVRTWGDGFRVAMRNQYSGGPRLLEIDPSGVATAIAYPPVPAGYTVRGFDSAYAALDAAGALYQAGERDPWNKVVVKFVPGAAVGTVVFDEGDGATDWVSGTWFMKFGKFDRGEHSGLLSGP